jgi:hypothetical protein
VSDIDTAAVDSLKALDPNRPIREADMKAGGGVGHDHRRNWLDRWDGGGI